MIADTKKNTGIYGEYQSGCSFDGAIRNSAPSEDWCSVERTTPKMVSKSVSLIMILRAFFRPSHSRAAGENSTNKTVRYRATQAATSNRRDVVPCCMIKG